VVYSVDLGEQADGSYGLVCAKPGYNVRSNPLNDEELVFNSAWVSALPVFYATGVVGLANGHSITIPYPETLSYVPFMSWMLALAPGGPWYPNPGTMQNINGADSGFFEVNIWGNGSELYLYNATGVEAYIFATIYRAAT
jgi:hypothetical protein